MPFSAINTYELELKQRNEQHTLELQLEQAMSVYQSALKHQTARDFDKAFAEYHRLFEFEVLQPQKLSNKHRNRRELLFANLNRATEKPDSPKQLGPSIRLRAMAQKNFALLLLRQPLATLDNVNEALVALCESLDLVGFDDREQLVLPSLVPLFWALECPKLARLSLEILVDGSETSIEQPLTLWRKNRWFALRNLGPRMIEYLESWDFITLGRSDQPLPHFLTKYLYLKQLIADLPTLSQELESESVASISLTTKSWENLVDSITDTLNTASRRAKRRGIRDGYAWSQRSIWSVQVKGILFNRQGTVEPVDVTQDSKSVGLSTTANADDAVVPTSTQISDSANKSTNYSFGINDSEDVADGDEGDNSKDQQLSGNVSENLGENIAKDDSVSESEILDAVPGNIGATNPKNDGLVANEATSEIPRTPQPSSPVISRPSAPNDGGSITASPAKRRRTERAKRSAVTLPADFGTADASFVSQINAYLALVVIDGTPQPLISPSSLFLEPNQIASPQLNGAAELRDILTSWDARASNQLLMKAASARPQKGGIMTTLRRGNVSLGDASPNSIDDDEELEDLNDEAVDVDNFVYSHEGLHIQQLRWDLAVEFLTRLSMGNCSPKFMRVTYNYLEDFEGTLYSRRNQLSPGLRTTLFGIYADKWIQGKNSEVEIRLVRWKLVSSQSPSLAHAWITAFVDQERDEASPESSVIQFQEILSHMQESDENSTLFTHLREIPALTIANAKMQISKFKAASAFERILSPVSTEKTDESGEKSNLDATKINEENIGLLEAMLMPENHTKPHWISDSEFDAIISFLSNAQPQFKMGLWYLLLEKYEAGGSVTNSLTGLTRIFVEAQSAFSKGEPLTSTFSICHDVGKRLVGLLERSPNLLFSELTIDVARHVLIEIVKLLQVLQLFVIYDEAVNSNLMQRPVTPSWNEASNKLRELVAIWWTLSYKFWLRCLDTKYTKTPETVNDILSIIHERLGHLGYCGLANGCLLSLHIAEIGRLNWSGSALDICQCVKCKFGLNLTLYGDISNHHTAPTVLNKEEARMILPLVMRMILNHRSYNQIVMRMDIRNAIDEFAGVLNLQEYPKHKLNVEKINSFLAQDFTPQILNQAWHGLQASSLTFPEIYDGFAIWTVQAHVTLTQYRMRRRQSYGPLSVKTESLITTIDYFINDISAKPTRFESWAGLAYSFLYLAEDCLAFGDEVTVPNTPGLYCRKALLAASQAVALQVAGKQNTLEIAVAQPEIAANLRTVIWSLLGHLFYLAVMPPLIGDSLLPTGRPPRPLLVQINDPGSFRLGTTKPHTLDEKEALKVAIKCLSMPAEGNQDWINAMYQTRAGLKLGLPTEYVFEFIKRAYELCNDSIHSPEVEYLSVVWTYYYDKKLNDHEAQTALKFLRPTSKEDTASDNKSVVEVIQDRLRRLLHHDKWLHKARFLLSKIEMSHFQNPVAAQEEILHVFSLKSPTKPLVIWNTDDNLPGEHSVAMSTYVRYLGELMFKNKDSKGLLLVTRRFRRAGVEMWNHAQVCDFLHGKACDLARSKISIDADKVKIGESLILTISNDDQIDFTAVVKSMSDPATSGFSEEDPWVQVLFYVLELRKNHTGLTTLASADELLICIFLTILKRYVLDHPPALPIALNSASPPTRESTPSAAETLPNDSLVAKKEKSRTKKLMRKDVVSAAQQFMKQFQAHFSKIDNVGLPEGDISI